MNTLDKIPYSAWTSGFCFNMGFVGFIDYKLLLAVVGVFFGILNAYLAFKREERIEQIHKAEAIVENVKSEKTVRSRTTI